MIAVLQYNSGNIMSVKLALERLGHRAVITSDPEVISIADKVIIPGVGEARSAMKHLKERGLDRVIVSLKQPVLGICLGLQLNISSHTLPCRRDKTVTANVMPADPLCGHKAPLAARQKPALLFHVF